MSRIRFWQGSRSSKSSYKLRKELRRRGYPCLRIKAEGSSYIPRSSDIIVNWGCTNDKYDSAPATTLNKSTYISKAVNKLSFFNRMEECGIREIPIFFTSYSDVMEWCESNWEEGMLIYCRTIITSHSGNGIVVAHSTEEVVDAPLYTVGIKDIEREVRVHIFDTHIIDITQKKRMGSERREEEGGITINEEIRNHSNGWVFAREGVCISDEIREMAERLVYFLSLDFCALDIVETRSGSFYFLECNTAPGLEGTTLIKYADALERKIQGI